MTIGTRMNYAIDQRVCSDDFDGDFEMMDSQSPGMAQAEAASAMLKREPERGVKKTASLRRGGAVYDQLLQSAVMASIAGGKEALMDDSPAYPPTSSPVGMMETEGFDSIEQPSPGKKKRTASQQLGQSDIRSKPKKNLNPTAVVITDPHDCQR